MKPASLCKVNDQSLKDFIEKCLVPASDRLSAKELLKDSFLVPEGGLKEEEEEEESSMSSNSNCGPQSMDIDPEYCQSVCTDSCPETPNTPILEFERVHQGKEFILKGMQLDGKTIGVALTIFDELGKKTSVFSLTYV